MSKILALFAALFRGGSGYCEPARHRQRPVTIKRAQGLDRPLPVFAGGPAVEISRPDPAIRRTKTSHDRAEVIRRVDEPFDYSSGLRLGSFCGHNAHRALFEDGEISSKYSIYPVPIRD